MSRLPTQQEQKVLDEILGQIQSKIQPRINVSQILIEDNLDVRSSFDYKTKVLILNRIIFETEESMTGFSKLFRIAHEIGHSFQNIANWQKWQEIESDEGDVILWDQHGDPSTESFANAFAVYVESPTRLYLEKPKEHEFMDSLMQRKLEAQELISLEDLFPKNKEIESQKGKKYWFDKNGHLVVSDPEGGSHYFMIIENIDRFKDLSRKDSDRIIEIINASQKLQELFSLFDFVKVIDSTSILYQMIGRIDGLYEKYFEIYFPLSIEKGICEGFASDQIEIVSSSENVHLHNFKLYDSEKFVNYVIVEQGCPYFQDSVNENEIESQSKELFSIEEWVKVPSQKGKIGIIKGIKEDGRLSIAFPGPGYYNRDSFSIDKVRKISQDWNYEKAYIHNTSSKIVFSQQEDLEKPKEHEFIEENKIESQEYKRFLIDPDGVVISIPRDLSHDEFEQEFFEFHSYVKDEDAEPTSNRIKKLRNLTKWYKHYKSLKRDFISDFTLEKDGWIEGSKVGKEFYLSSYFNNLLSIKNLENFLIDNYGKWKITILEDISGKSFEFTSDDFKENDFKLDISLLKLHRKSSKKFSSFPESKSFVDYETRTTADISLVEDYISEVPGKAYWFNRLKSGIQGKGGGTKILKQVLEFIDQVGLPLVNQPNAYGALSQEDLVKFYKKHGFIESKEFGDELLIYYPKIRKVESKELISIGDYVEYEPTGNIGEVLNSSTADDVRVYFEVGPIISAELGDLKKVSISWEKNDKETYILYDVLINNKKYQFRSLQDLSNIEFILWHYNKEIGLEKVNGIEIQQSIEKQKKLDRWIETGEHEVQSSGESELFSVEDYVKVNWKGFQFIAQVLSYDQVTGEVKILFPLSRTRWIPFKDILSRANIKVVEDGNEESGGKKGNYLLVYIDEIRHPTVNSPGWAKIYGEENAINGASFEYNVNIAGSVYTWNYLTKEDVVGQKKAQQGWLLWWFSPDGKLIASNEGITRSQTHSELAQRNIKKFTLYSPEEGKINLQQKLIDTGYIRVGFIQGGDYLQSKAYIESRYSIPFEVFQFLQKKGISNVQVIRHAFDHIGTVINLNQSLTEIGEQLEQYNMRLAELTEQIELYSVGDYVTIIDSGSNWYGYIGRLEGRNDKFLILIVGRAISILFSDGQFRKTDIEIREDKRVVNDETSLIFVIRVEKSKEFIVSKLFGERNSVAYAVFDYNDMIAEERELKGELFSVDDYVIITDLSSEWYKYIGQIDSLVDDEILITFPAFSGHILCDSSQFAPVNIDVKKNFFDPYDKSWLYDVKLEGVDYGPYRMDYISEAIYAAVMTYNENRHIGRISEIQLYSIRDYVTVIDKNSEFYMHVGLIEGLEDDKFEVIFPGVRQFDIASFQKDQIRPTQFEIKQKKYNSEYGFEETGYLIGVESPIDEKDPLMYRIEYKDNAILYAISNYNHMLPYTQEMVQKSIKDILGEEDYVVKGNEPILCAWCKKKYFDKETKEWKDVEEELKWGGHGICEECKGRELKSSHDFSSVQIILPEDTSKEVIDWGNQNIPESEIYIDPKDDSFGREDNPHITVKYGLHDKDCPSKVKEYIDAIGAFKVILKKISIFESDHYDVVKIDVDSDELYLLNILISDNCKITDTHPEYKPHITIAYVNKDEGQKYINDDFFEGKEFEVEKIEFNGKNDKKESLRIGEFSVDDRFHLWEDDGLDAKIIESRHLFSIEDYVKDSEGYMGKIHKLSKIENKVIVNFPSIGYKKIEFKDLIPISIQVKKLGFRKRQVLVDNIVIDLNDAANDSVAIYFAMDTNNREKKREKEAKHLYSIEDYVRILSPFDFKWKIGILKSLSDMQYEILVPLSTGERVIYLYENDFRPAKLDIKFIPIYYEFEKQVEVKVYIEIEGRKVNFGFYSRKEDFIQGSQSRIYDLITFFNDGLIYGLEEDYYDKEASIVKADEESFKDRLGRCYELSGSYVMNHPESILVHGKIYNPRQKEGLYSQIDHSWVEEGDEVYDPVMNLKLSKDAYYRLFNAEVYHIYTHDDVIHLCIKVRHWGPWSKEEIELMNEIRKELEEKSKKFKKKGEFFSVEDYVLIDEPKDIELKREEKSIIQPYFLKEQIHKLSPQITIVIDGIRNIADKNDLDLYIAGGMVRDLLMGVDHQQCDMDLDITASKPGDALMAAYQMVLDEHLPSPDIHKWTGVATVSISTESCVVPVSIDFKGERVYRTWVYDWLKQNNLPTDYLSVDVFGRDFTIDSLLVSVDLEQILDISQLGVKDIEDKRLRTLIDPDVAIKNSPIIMLRALRFMKQFDMTIDKDLDEAIKNNSMLINQENDMTIMHTLSKYSQYG